MPNKARIPHHLQKQAYRWTRPPLIFADDSGMPSPECTLTQHIWVFKDGNEPASDDRCLCGKHAYGANHDPE